MSIANGWPLLTSTGGSGTIVVSFKTDSEIIGCGFGNSFDQSWVNVRYAALNKYTTGLQGMPYLNGCGLAVDPATQMLKPVPTH